MVVVGQKNDTYKVRPKTQLHISSQKMTMASRASANIEYRPEFSHLVGLLGDCRHNKKKNMNFTTMRCK